MLTTLSSGQSSCFLLPTFVQGSVTQKPAVHGSEPHGSSRTDGVAKGPSLTLYCPLGSLLEHRQMAETLWLTASFHALPTTYRVAVLSHV